MTYPADITTTLYKQSSSQNETEVCCEMHYSCSVATSCKYKCTYCIHTVEQTDRQTDRQTDNIPACGAGEYTGEGKGRSRDHSHFLFEPNSFLFKVFENDSCCNSTKHNTRYIHILYSARCTLEWYYEFLSHAPNTRTPRVRPCMWEETLPWRKWGS